MIVLDASALLAVVGRGGAGEPGADVVRHRLADEGGVISAVNWAETLGKLSDRGEDFETIAHAISGTVAGTDLLIEPFHEPLAREAARVRAILRRKHPRADISFADRACLALGRALGWEILTGDRDWLDVAGSLGVTVACFR